MNSLLFTYYDINIYEKDKSYFLAGEWVNDVCINFSLKHFEEEEVKGNEYRKTIFFFDPAVVSFLNLQVDSDEEYEELRAAINLRDRVWLFVPISDNASFDGAATHWSLLVCNLQTNEAFHLDSANNYNTASAGRVLAKINCLVMRELTFNSLQVPQQQNSYDCGIYTILYAKAVTKYILENVARLRESATDSMWWGSLGNFIKETVDADAARSLRKFMLKTIDSFTQR